MEQINQNDQEQVSIVQGYIDHFKNRMNIEMKQPDFEPNATQEYNGYDGVTTELNKNFASMGIDKTEIFLGLEQTEALLRGCTHVKNVQSFSKDQLRDALIGGTRRPYHDLRTDKLYDDVTKNMQVEDLLDSRLVAELLLKEREKGEKIKKILGYIQNYRSQYDSCTTIEQISDIMNNFLEELSLVDIFPLVNFLPEEKKQYFYNTIVTEQEKKDNNLSDEYSIRKYLEKDPIYGSLTGSTPVIGMKKIIDDDRLARILFEVSL